MNPMLRFVLHACLILPLVLSPSLPARAERSFRGNHRPRILQIQAPEAAKDAEAKLPELIGFATEVLDHGKWRRLDDREALHDDDDVRYVPTLTPNDFSQVEFVRMLKKPQDHPKQPWVAFASSKRGDRYVSGNIEPGHWLVSMEVVFKNGKIVRLHP